MATAMYLEHYLDSLESLPSELQRNFTLMRDLDQRAQDTMKEIEKIAEIFLRNVRTMNIDRRLQHLNSINSQYNKSLGFGDEKVQLAMQTYEMVDKHIRKLDADLARFEADLKEKSITKPKEGPRKVVPIVNCQVSHLCSLDVKNGKQIKRNKRITERKTEAIKVKDKKKRKSMKAEYEDEIPKKKKNKKSSQQIQPDSENSLPSLPLSITHPSDVLDMPVDPNEPTYCLCHQVSYGEMIGCDNPDCPIEWFHFACVGLTTKPKGKWYCPRCQEERKKK